MSSNLFKRCVVLATNCVSYKMGRLFWKIFLSFWLSLLLVLFISNWGTALYLQSQGENQRESNRTQLIESRLDAIQNALHYGGIYAANRLFGRRKQPPRPFVELTISDHSGMVLIHKKRRRMPPPRPDIVIEQIKQSSMDQQGQQYFITAKVIKRARVPPLFGFLRLSKKLPMLLIIWFGVAIVISGAVCFWLAWYLTKPIRYLQSASHRLAEGELSTRVANKMAGRNDEISDLGKDFDYMAARLESLLASQKQLLSDISHELRSPLARLQVAVGLVHQKTSSAALELERIEVEISRIDELVGQLLTLSRLETERGIQTEDCIDLALLLKDIVHDADFEARDQHKQVVLTVEQTWMLDVNVELLRRAIENIVRNAIRYTAEHTQVTVSLSRSKIFPDYIQIEIIDQGLGVPEEQLEQVFEPFVRVSNSRDRQSGGYGLGLAIAQRAVQLHKGKIRAKNLEKGGFCVAVLLPLSLQNFTLH